MKKISAVTVKEFQLLCRDRAGLLILFLMPAVLVVLITLVQKNVMEMTGQTKTRLVFLDQDNGGFGRTLKENLASGHLEVISMDREQYSISRLESDVEKGRFQVGLVVEEGVSSLLDAQAARLIRQKKPAGGQGREGNPAIRIVFDPGILAGLRSGILAQVRMAVRSISVTGKLKFLQELLQQVPGSAGLSDSDQLYILGSSLLVVNDAGEGRSGKGEYNPVQQNVPAWALFGMFFTAIPIAGSSIRERKSGIWIRLMSLPVSPLQLAIGKILTYIGVCMVQFVLIGLIGLYLFPVIGLPQFSIGAHPAGVLLVALCSSLAACGFGMLLGLVCSSYEQASAVGSTMVVASAALGGVMVPVYAMPVMMQKISIISPLNWGLSAFQDLLIRGSDLAGVLPDLGRLVAFFFFVVVFSWKLVKNRL